MGGKSRKRQQKTRVQVFISYARANKTLANDFLYRFKQQTDASRRYRYTFWHDGKIEVGEEWDGEIRDAIGKCDLGLLLVSPAYLGSRYIKRVELPKFARHRGKSAVPVMLWPVDFKLHDLDGLGGRQIFRLEKGVKEPRAYGDCSPSAKRDAFAHHLFQKVESKLDRLFARQKRRGK